MFIKKQIEHILEEAEESACRLVIDSIQTMRCAGTPGLPGSRPGPGRCASAAGGQDLGMVCLLVGHITKSGLLAGPKLIEHMVDVVLYFEGDSRYPCRVLRVTKNRFGSSREIALYDLNEEGIQPVENPSAMLLEGRRPGQSGTVVTPVLEGSLPLLVEVQALVSGGNPGNPRRLVTGLDYQRVAMVLAVLEKRGGLPLAGRDVYVSAIGGVRAEEPACDLAVALAVASSFYDHPLPMTWRPLASLASPVRSGGSGRAKRWEAIRRHGFTRAVVPRGCRRKPSKG